MRRADHLSIAVLPTVVRRCVDLDTCLIFSTAESLSGVLVCARNLICIAFHTFGYQSLRWLKSEFT